MPAMCHDLKTSTQDRSWYGSCQVCTADEIAVNEDDKVVVMDIGNMQIRLCRGHAKVLAYQIGELPE